MRREHRQVGLLVKGAIEEEEVAVVLRKAAAKAAARGESGRRAAVWRLATGEHLGTGAGVVPLLRRVLLAATLQYVYA